MGVFQALEQEIEQSKNQNEKEYFSFHKERFRRFDQFLDPFSKTFEKNKKPKVLEIGSHYLHSSVLLSKNGFLVDAMDVGEFWALEFVQNRAQKFELNPLIENDISKMDRFKGLENQYDLIVFTEILEHITFNPIEFWKTIYKLLRVGGKIYISTPNSLALPNYFRNLKNLLFFNSIGITVEDIFSKVTYGHHWKEYSAKEIEQYFSILSDDFEVQIHPYQYKQYDLKPPYLVFKLLSKIGNLFKIFSDDLEVIVSLNSKTNWKITSPDY